MNPGKLTKWTLTAGALLLVACAAASVAIAQDKPDKVTTVKFNGSGTFAGTPTTPCSEEDCYSITGSVTTSMSGLGTGDITGDASVDKCKINKAAKRKCCVFASSETYTFTDGALDVLIGGTACGKSVTNITVKHARFEITAGTGLFDGATGSGKANLTFDEDTGEGTISFSGKLKE